MKRKNRREKRGRSEYVRVDVTKSQSRTDLFLEKVEAVQKLFQIFVFRHHKLAIPLSKTIAAQHLQHVRR